ncbi:MAG: DUF4956 domain-containing protein [Gammaproteobacteria bacterium]|jgi:hypothetical protein|nr:DUF4956 domain-containing protein [Gammaproteobacteria bacterium]
MNQSISAQRLILNLTAYFVLLFGSVFAAGVMKPELLSAMPLGGTNVLEVAGIEVDAPSIDDKFSLSGGASIDQKPTARQIALITLFLALSLGGTLLVMLPITWTYAATRREVGFRKNFVRALMVLPICATTIVLLIQNNLALAFGLAAMVAAVRFRVALQEAIDGIYIFSSICIGLAAGIGHLGIAAVMALFFCFTNVLLWRFDYGSNPIDDARLAKKRGESQLSASLSERNQSIP